MVIICWIPCWIPSWLPSWIPCWIPIWPQSYIFKGFVFLRARPARIYSKGIYCCGRAQLAFCLRARPARTFQKVYIAAGAPGSHLFCGRARLAFFQRARPARIYAKGIYCCGRAGPAAAPRRPRPAAAPRRPFCSSIHIPNVFRNAHFVLQYIYTMSNLYPFSPPINKYHSYMLIYSDFQPRKRINNAPQYLSVDIFARKQFPFFSRFVFW